MFNSWKDFTHNIQHDFESGLCFQEFVGLLWVEMNTFFVKSGNRLTEEQIWTALDCEKSKAFFSTS